MLCQRTTIDSGRLSSMPFPADFDCWKTVISLLWASHHAEIYRHDRTRTYLQHPHPALDCRICQIMGKIGIFAVIPNAFEHAL